MFSSKDNPQNIQATLYAGQNVTAPVVQDNRMQNIHQLSLVLVDTLHL
jgi:hypothetical protein